jgi:hypothetical protein
MISHNTLHIRQFSDQAQVLGIGIRFYQGQNFSRPSRPAGGTTRSHIERAPYVRSPSVK